MELRREMIAQTGAETRISPNGEHSAFALVRQSVQFDLHHRLDGASPRDEREHLV